jgi:hypothetical protein
MRTLVITIADTKGIFEIDEDADREREIIVEYGHRKTTATLTGFLEALGLEKDGPLDKK